MQLNQVQTNAKPIFIKTCKPMSNLVQTMNKFGATARQALSQAECQSNRTLRQTEKQPNHGYFHCTLTSSHTIHKPDANQIWVWPNHFWPNANHFVPYANLHISAFPKRFAKPSRNAPNCIMLITPRITPILIYGVAILVEFRFGPVRTVR